MCERKHRTLKGSHGGSMVKLERCRLSALFLALSLRPSPVVHSYKTKEQWPE